jgi:prepilin-type N-terminal cleavage/methylation domain-containing protein
MSCRGRIGFTLIELSIVLVIIGLITGGVLVGRDLIVAARLRAQITQIEKYKTATATFKAKYGALPGDMVADDADALGFFARGGGPGDGDGNGRIEWLGIDDARCPFGVPCLGGEDIFFWTDLSAAGLVDGSFADSSDILISASPAIDFSKYFPAGKIERNSSVLAFDNVHPRFISAVGIPNYSGLVFEVAPGDPASAGDVLGSAFTAQEALSIDTKMDDGLPLSGMIEAAMCGYVSSWGSCQAPLGLITDTSAPGPRYCVSPSAATYVYSTAWQSEIATCNLLFGVRL